MPQDSAADNPASPCPGPCDVAIPIVYPSQPITIPAAEVERQIPFDIDVRASLTETFTNPDSRPPLRIARWVGDNAKVLGLGHAGIAMINGRTGGVAYWEYGRYDAASYGEVRSVAAVSALTMAFDPETGNPTPASLNALAGRLIGTNGGPYAVEAAYIKLPNDSYGLMNSFARDRKRDVAARQAARYDVAGNHCFTFAMEVAAYVGVRTSAARQAPKLDVELRGGNALTRGLISWRAPEFEVPARQMRALQQSYQKLIISAGGTVSSAFRYPLGLNSK
ncbi:MAG: hypothetical protein AAGE03_06090 [Pseudomonadota bacterium]